MKAYKVYTTDMMGFEDSKTIYTTSYTIAVKHFNEQLQTIMAENDIITDKESFGDIKTRFKEPPLSEPKFAIEIICMKAPYIIYKQGNRLQALVHFDYKCSYEYDEYDEGINSTCIEEIEML
ncbi:hypothetical protein [Clostridium estertheticum]|uniref:hypothetical protein n=1 Tax=Clostridium estertheticum TaxID=238834 RepID=UPI001C7CE6C7|nr:hypothetical protein [Clostridium estertheticum]MBX4266577.1 hypothetical protein [Clostridium estertheticum]WLC88083.1 hypothetical protein KTC95_19010 [Clostridium estertheticum]